MRLPVRHRLPFILAAFALSALSCGREVTGPENGVLRNRVAMLAFAPEFSGPMAVIEGAGDAVPFEKVRVVLRGLDGNIVKDTMVDFPSDAEEISLALTIAIPQNSPAEGLPLTVSMAYVNAAGDTVFRGGPNPIIARPVGSSGAGTPVTVPVTYDGTGKDATRVAIAPKTGTAVAGTSLAFSATAFDAADQSIPNTPFVFSTLDPTRATVNPVTGVATWLPVRGTARVIAELPNGVRADTATFTVTLPAAKLVLGSGGAQSGAVNAPLVDTIVVRTLASDDVPVEGVVVNFAVATGGGTLSVLSDTSDANGDVKTVWTLGAALGAQSISATADGLTGSPLSIAATAVAATPVRLEITQHPTGTEAGALLAPALTVIARDAFGNAITSFTDEVTVSVAGTEPPTLLGTASQAAVAGSASFGDLALTRAGAFQLVVSSGALAPDTTEILAIAPAAATQLVMIAHPTSTVGAGATFSAGVEVQDAFGNRVSDWATPVQAGFDLAPSGATFVSGGSADVIDGVADFTDLQLDRAGTYRLRFTSGALTAALSDDFTVLAAGPEAMNAVAGDLQSAAAGTTLPTPLAVVVSDNFGNPISGVSVTWTVTAGGGSMSAPSSVTDSLGQASVTWTLGSVAGPQLATASAGFLPEVEFSATATIGEPSALLSAGGDAQSATVMEYVESPLRARVTDAFGNGVSGVIVNFNVISGLATVDAPSVATDSAGYAATSVRMDSVAGPVLVGAFAAGLTPDSLLYELTALPAAPNALLIVAGDGQSIATGDTTDTLRVRLIDGYGNPIAGETVTWDSPSGLTFTSTSGVTDSLGDVSTTVIAGGALGLLDVYARLALPELSAYFTVSVEVGPAVSLAIVSAPSGSNAGQTLSPLIVELRDAFGHVARLSEATVEVAVDGTLTPGALGGTLSVLADSGVAVFADLALTQAGPYALVVSASGVSPDTTEAFTVEPGEAMSIEYASADSVSAVVGGALETPLAVLLRDAYGNPVPNSPTNWYVSLSNAAQLDSSDLHTDSLGVARATLQVPTLAETFFVTADAFDAGSLIFTVRSTNAPGSTLTIESGPAGGEYRAGDSLQLLVARVQDAYGNVALDYAGDVTVEVDSGPAGATLLGMTTRAATAGVATFDDLALDLAGEYRLRVYAVGTDTSVTSALYVYGREAERIQIVDGDAQTDTVGQTLAQPLRVRVTDRFGNPVSEARVDWDGGEQVFIGELPASTDFNGEIAAPITLGSNAGTHPVTASLFELPDSTVTFTVTAVPDAADALFVVTAPDTAVAGDSVTIVIEARDSYGNRATGFAQNVTIEATDAAGEALGVTTVAADSGIATFSAIYFEAYGNYFMQAMADGLSYAYINLDVLPGTASQLTVESGDNQTAFAGSLLDSTIVLRLTDDFGNPIEAAEILVTRDIGTGDLGDFTDSLRVETDWDGRASFPWTLGPELGEQTLRALTESAGPIVIAATALQPVANVVWTGNTSTNPTDPSNWSTFTVPTQTDSVLIPAARNFYPTLTGFTTWGRLTVADGASINLASYWLNVRGSVRTPETGITGVTNSALVALDSGTVSGGFPTLRIEGTHSTAGFVRVQNSLTIPGSLTVAADDSLHVVGGVETFSGLPGSGLHQVGPSGIYIGGNLSGDAESTFGAGGRLHLLGDLTSGQLGSRAFVADSAHELYLLPGRTQALSLWEYDDNISGPCLRSCFGRIIAQKAPGQGGISIGNLFGSPVTLRARGGFLVDVDAINANTSALIIGAPSMLRSQDWAAFGRVTFDGALDAPRITADTLVALGTGLLPPQIEAPIVVVGNRQVDSELYGPVLVDGSLDVVGPNAIAGDLRTRGNGYLRMTEPNDTLLVYGELRLEGTAAAGQLTAGFLDVFGNLYIGSGPAVLAEANHTTRVRDFSPSITVIDPPSSQLGSLLVDSSNVLTLIADGLTLQGDLRLDGAGAQLVEARPSVVTVGNRLLDPNGNLNVSTVIVDGADGVQTPSVSGNLIVRGRSLLSDDLDVAASLTISDRGELTLGGHRVNVTGDFRTTASGSLRMQVSADTLRVLGDAVFGGGSTEGQLTAGVLELHRNLQQLRGDETFATFYSSVEHIVHFAGGTTNQISFESSNDTDGSRIGNLRIEKQDGQVTLPSGSLFVENIIGSFSNAGFSVGSSTLAANLYILGSVSPTVSSLERGFTIDALGNVQVLRGEGPGCTVNSIRVDGNRANFSPEACQLQP